MKSNGWWVVAAGVQRFEQCGLAALAAKSRNLGALDRPPVGTNLRRQRCAVKLD